MATLITDECIACGLCAPACPVAGISRGDGIYIVDPERCTECVGFHGERQCALVCPVDCCVLDPQHRETEAQLLSKARRIAPGWLDDIELSPATSHFRQRSVSGALGSIGRQLVALLRPAGERG